MPLHKRQGMEGFHQCRKSFATSRMLLARLLPAWLGGLAPRWAAGASAVSRGGASLCVALRALCDSPNARATSLRPLRTTPALLLLALHAAEAFVRASL